MKKLLLSSLVTTSIFAFAYTDTDVSTASFLANQGIIVNQSTASNYRLDNTITRAEAIGIALKIKGVTLPESYTCKKYFSDTITNDWKCRAIELAADNGIITRGNAQARPNDTITRAEALAIVMKAGGVSIETFSQEYFARNWVGESDINWTDVNQFSADWQKNVFFSFKKNINRTVPGQSTGLYSDSGSVSYKYFPNRAATRAEVFGFTKNILEYIVKMVSGEVTN